MDGRWLRVVVGLVVFAVATVVGVLAVGNFNTAADPTTFINQVTADSWALILAIAMVLGFGSYFAVEYLQTRRLASLEAEFTTRTFALMPVAIALNIILGAAVGNALKIPIYLDSIGTILVGVLCGPFAGALTGGLANLLAAYVVPPPFQQPTLAAFAITAVVIGLIAGVVGRAGFMRPRPNTPTPQLVLGGLVTVALVGLMSALAFFGYQAILGQASLAPASDNTIFVVLGWLALALVAITLIGLILLLAVRRDLTAAYVVVCGVLTGMIAALISAPIAAGVYGGVTAAGTDFLVAAFRQAGADIQAATLGQGLISDPIDKVTTFFIVYLILNALARRTKARFPQGEQLIERGGVQEAFA
jgi:hypothetical protein